MKVKLTKLSSAHQNLRTDEVIGVAPTLPKVGVSFVLYGQALEGPGVRIVHTSPVVEVLNGSPLEFKTLNSHYRLDLL